MLRLPICQDPPVIRTEFSDALAWEEVKRLVVAPSTEDQFQAYVTFVDNPAFSGMSADQLLQSRDPGDQHGFFFVVDTKTLSNAGYPILVVDCSDLPGRRFRVIPSWMWSVENNLSLSNMGFEEFVDAVGQDGIFRGF